jgi:hypothetical protein
MPDSMTQILSSGPTGTKVNIAVLGDGFADGADQTTYNKVQDLLLNGLFRHDYYYYEDIQAFNIFRVNLISVDSGVGVKTYDNGNLLSTTNKNTALGFYFNGSWSHCWVEAGPNSWTLVNNALSTWVPDHQLVLILLNNPGFGGCGGGGVATLPLGVSWDTIAHEFGHGLGGFCDEYCVSGPYGVANRAAPISQSIPTARRSSGERLWTPVRRCPPVPGFRDFGWVCSQRDVDGRLGWRVAHRHCRPV